MRRIIIAAAVLTILLCGTLAAQDTYFGKNKVRYKDFDWSFIQTRHFDVYFYEEGYPTAKFAAEVAESSYVEISRELEYKLKRRVPIFVYNSHNDFQQTNIISMYLSEGVAGFTETFKNRVVLPFDGSYESFRETIHHELTHAATYDMLYGNMFSALLSRQRLFVMPAWLAEGYAAYSSRHGWEYWSDMFVRDATVNNYLIPPQYLSGYQAYRQGQAMIKYIADKWGEEKIGELFKKGKILLTMDKAMKATLGIDQEKFFEEFSKEMKRRYWPEIAVRDEPHEIARQLTHAREDGSFFNEHPKFSPNGDRIAIFSDISDFTEIIMISAEDGKKIKSLVKSQRTADLESLHAYVSGMSFSPDGRDMVFVAKSKGKEAIFFYNIKKDDVYRKVRLDYYNIISPVWSPDGKMVAFSALDGHKRDIFIYHIETGAIDQITDDRFDDVDPTWMKNSQELIFVSDRPHPQTPVVKELPYTPAGVLRPGNFDYGYYNIFRVKLGDLRVRPVDVGPGQNKDPEVSPDGDKIAFISNRNGIDNIYVAYLDSTKYFAVTNVLTGVMNLSWSPDGKRLAFSAINKGAYDIFVAKDIVPVGDNGVLEPTDFVLGKYEHTYRVEPARLAKAPSAEPADTIAADSTVADADLPVMAEADQPIETDSSMAVEPAADSLAMVAEATPDSMAMAEVPPGDSTTTDSMPAELATEPPGDSIVADTAGAEVAETPAEDSVITETGTYDDEFVFVAEETVSADPLDSLMKDIAEDTTRYTTLTPEEQAAFDSIPPKLPSGEYSISKYKVKFTPDYMGGGFQYDTFFGLRGQTYFVFSDYLGNHQLYLATDLVNTIDQSVIQAFYLNGKNRINLGAGFFHTKNYYEDNWNFLFSDRFYGVQLFASRPFSTFSRLELTASQFFVDRKYYDYFAPENRSSKVTTVAGSWVTDNVLWGYTGPINGRRTKVTLESGVNLFDTGDMEFYAASFDFRRYSHFGSTFSLALRVSGAASTGRTPKEYFLGGTSNWIGSRTVDDNVYAIKNLYFSDVITPLRGVPYYEIAGDRYGLVNVEFRFPMVQYLITRFPLRLAITNVTGVTFMDMGAAWYGSDFKGGTSAGGSSRLQDIKTGFGFGMRANLLGFILLRYDLAWTTDFAEVSDKPTYYFSFGADF